MARSNREETLPVRAKRKRGPRGNISVVREHAVAYGIEVPQESKTTARFLSPNDIGKIMNVTGEAVKQWIYRRKLPAVKLANGYWKVRVTDFESFLTARQEVGRRHVLVSGGVGENFNDVVQAIEELGHQAIMTHNFADGMLKALDHFPALFIINLSSTSSEPWKFAEKIRSTKALRSFPILFVSDTNLLDSDAERALGLYAQGLLTRPFRVETLSAEIDRILKRAM